MYTNNDQSNNGQNGQEKTIKMYITVILRAMQHKRKRMIKIWVEFAEFNITSQRLSDRARIVLKKVELSDLEILEIYGQVSREDHVQKLFTWIEIENTETKKKKHRPQHHNINVNTRQKMLIKKIVTERR